MNSWLFSRRLTPAQSPGHVRSRRVASPPMLVNRPSVTPFRPEASGRKLSASQKRDKRLAAAAAAAKRKALQDELDRTPRPLPNPATKEQRLQTLVKAMTDRFVSCCWAGPALPNKHLLVLMLMGPVGGNMPVAVAKDLIDLVMDACFMRWDDGDDNEDDSDGDSDGFIPLYRDPRFSNHDGEDQAELYDMNQGYYYKSDDDEDDEDGYWESAISDAAASLPDDWSVSTSEVLKYWASLPGLPRGLGDMGYSSWKWRALPQRRGPRV